MKVTPISDLWKCGYCRKHYVVPELARACERKHEVQE